MSATPLVLIVLGMVGMLALSLALFAADIFITERHCVHGHRTNTWLEGELGMGYVWPDECKRGTCGCSGGEVDHGE